MRIINKIFKVICNILIGIIGVLILVTAYAWLQVNAFHKDYASILGYSMFDVVTGSMSGTIEINDYVIVKNTKDIKLNDIITYKEGTTLVTHRVIEIAGDKIIAKGDANNSSDYAITYDVVIGKVVKIIPKAGIWKNVFTDMRVLICVLITLVFFTVFFSIEEKKYKKVKKKANLDMLIPKEEKVKKERKVVKANLDALKK